ncbi:MAG: hypothetical protein J6U86_02470, partial [Clostridia bacterium]|nr:hypothetical protein [Clostridia bacterium]
NGIATVGNGNGNMLVYNGDGTVTDLDNCNDEYTLMFNMEVDTTNGWTLNPSQNAYFYYHGGTGNITSALIFESTGENTVRPRYRMFWGRGNGPVSDNVNSAMTGYNTFAISVEVKNGVEWATVYVNGVEAYKTDAASGSGSIMNSLAVLQFGAGQLTNGLDWGVWANYEDIRLYDRAFSADEIFDLQNTINNSLMNKGSDVILFEGVQFRNTTDKKVDIRFVAKVPKARFTEMGFDFDIVRYNKADEAQGRVENVNVKCEVAYKKLAYDKGYYNAGYGSYYLAVTLEDVEFTDNINYYTFDFISYAKGTSSTYYGDKYRLKVTDSKKCYFMFLQNNEGELMAADKLPAGENELLEGYVKFQSDNGTQAAPCWDFQGGLIQDVMGEEHAQNMMKSYADAGYTRIYVTVPGDGLPVFSDTRCSANTTKKDRRYAQNLEACGGNILKFYNRVAHEYGLKMIAVYKPYEGGGGVSIPEGQIADNCDFYEDTIGGRRVYFDNFIKKHPEMRLVRRDNGYVVDPNKNITKIESVFVLDEIRNYKGELEGSSYAGNFTAVTAAQIQSALSGSEGIKLYVGTDNHTYSEYTGNKNITWTQEVRNVYDANGLLKMANANVYVMNITGLNLKPDTYIGMVIPEGVNTKLRTIPYSNISLYSGNEKLTTSVTLYVRNVWGFEETGSTPYNILWGFEKEPTHTQGASLYGKWNDVRYERWEGHNNSISLFDRFTKYGFEFEYAGAGNGGEGWATAKIYGIAAGKPQYVAGALCEGYEEVRQHWFDYTVWLLDECDYDGIEYRMLNHSTFITDPINYGYNEPIVAKYKELYGVDLSDPSVVVTEEMYVKIMKIRGDFFMQFLEQVDKYTEATGKSFGMHVIDAYEDESKWNMDHTNMNSLISPYRPKI